MTIYVPVTRFSNGGVIHDIEVLDSDKCRILGGYIEHCGTIYGDAKNAYTDPRGVWHFWDKEDWRADKYRYSF